MLNRRECLQGAIALAGVAALGRASATDAAVVALSEQRGRYMVEVAINGRSGYQFVLDTGASTHFISARAARELGLKQVEERSVQGFDGAKPTPVVQIAKLVVGGVDLGRARAISWAPEEIEDHDGLIGYPFLYPSAVIDLGASQVRFGGDRPADMTAVQAKVMRDQALLVGGFAGAEGRYVFDTGAQGCTLSADYHERVAQTPAYADASKLIYRTTDGDARVAAFRPMEMVFGDFHIPKPIVSVGRADDQRAGVFRGVDALFGVSLIRPFSWAIDQAGATLGAAGEPPQQLGWYGSGFSLDAGATLARVSGVQEGGPAHEAGLRPGQAVVAVNGRVPSPHARDLRPPSDRASPQVIEVIDGGLRRTFAFDTRALL